MTTPPNGHTTSPPQPPIAGTGRGMAGWFGAVCDGLNSGFGLYPAAAPIGTSLRSSAPSAARACVTASSGSSMDPKLRPIRTGGFGAIRSAGKGAWSL